MGSIDIKQSNMRNNMKREIIEDFITNELSAKEINISEQFYEELRYIIIGNEYTTILLNKAVEIYQLPIEDILKQYGLIPLSRKIQLSEIQVDIHVYRLPNKGLIEIDYLSHYIASRNDKNNNLDKLQQFLQEQIKT